MPDTDTIPVSASIASTGKGIRYIGDYAYAYSGALAAAGSPGTDYLDFTTGAGLIIANVQWFYIAAATNDVNYRHYLNEIKSSRFI